MAPGGVSRRLNGAQAALGTHANRDRFLNGHSTSGLSGFCKCTNGAGSADPTHADLFPALPSREPQRYWLAMMLGFAERASLRY
jgi:hypothetical protein